MSEYKQGVLFEISRPETKILLEKSSVELLNTLNGKSGNWDTKLKILRNVINFVENKSTSELEILN